MYVLPSMSVNHAQTAGGICIKLRGGDNWVGLFDAVLERPGSEWTHGWEKVPGPGDKSLLK